MMIKYTVTSEEFSQLEESQQGLYTQGEDGYKLNVEGVITVEEAAAREAGLRENRDKLLAEKKRIDELKREAEAEAKRQQEEKLKKANDYEQLYNSSEQERQRSEQALRDLESKIQRQQVNGKSLELASSLTKDTARAKLLSEQIASRLTLVDGELKVQDKQGNLTVSTVEELTSSIKAEYPFLVDGLESTGGGAIGSASGTGDSKTVSRADFDAMNAQKRMDYIKSGGKII